MTYTESEIISVIQRHGSIDLVKALVGDLKSFNPDILALGEISHFGPVGFHDTLSSILSAISSMGFSQAGIELSSDFASLFADFMRTGDIHALESAVCSPQSGRLNANCKNRYCMDYHILFGIGDTREFMPDYREVLEALRRVSLSVACIDGPKNGLPDLRDESMASAIESIKKGQSSQVVWWGGARHVMHRNGANETAAEKLITKGHTVFSVVGLDAGEDLPEHMQSTVDLSKVRTICANLDKPIYIRTSALGAGADTVIYTDYDGVGVRFSHFDAAILYPRFIPT